MRYFSFFKTASALCLPAVVLSACASPQEICINRANQELRTVEQLIYKNQLDLERGYSIQTQKTTQTDTTWCERDDWPYGPFYKDRSYRDRGYRDRFYPPDFYPRYEPCQRTRVTTSEIPVAIDASIVRARLSELRARRAELEITTPNAIANCIALYPNETR